MKRAYLIKMTAVALSCAGMIIPQAMLASPAGPRQPQTAVVDVQLQEGNVFQGMVVDTAGAPLANTKVIVFNQDGPVAETRTDEEGRFALGPLRGGTYQVSTARSTGVYRLWAPRTAPPTARPTVLLVEGADVLRGQVGPASMFLTNPWVVVGIIGAAIAVPIAVNNRASGS